MGDLSTHFSRVEFTCRCGCGVCRVSPRLLDMLDKARDIAGTAFRITSGCRCRAHNAAVSKAPDSAHLTEPEGQVCEAADIATPSSRYRYVVLMGLMGAGFDRIGINFAAGFIHADVDRDKDRDVLFSY